MNQLSPFHMRGLAALALAGLGGCAPDYSPNTYASNAVQQANKVEPGVVVGFRQVEISANGTVGAVTGGAAGGVLGAQADASSITAALGAVGGALVGGLVGTGIEHAANDTTGWEYIVRKPNGELLSVTQREKTPIALGQKVLVITGNQARIVADYSTPMEEKPAPAKEAAKEPEKAPEKEAEKPKTPEPAVAKEAAPAPPPAPAPAPAEAAPAPASAPAAASSPVDAAAPADPDSEKDAPKPPPSSE
jgi:outer membrane lipoprotein SlyB